MTEKKRMCLHCYEKEQLKNNNLCEDCIKIPRCEVCTVIFGNIVNPSTKKPKRCDGCVNYEERIKFNCIICDAKLPVFFSKRSSVLHFLIRGNVCTKCNQDCEQVARSASGKSGRRPAYDGYVAIMENLYLAGKIGKEYWEEIKLLNPQGVNQSYDATKN